MARLFLALVNVVIPGDGCRELAWLGRLGLIVDPLRLF